MVLSARKSAFRASVIMGFAVSAVALAGCTSSSENGATAKRSKEYFSEAEYGVKASPRVSSAGSQLPRGGGRDHIGKPYKVRGVWYYPKEDRRYNKMGAASWYGDAFHGRLTANGEIYDQTHLTAAHPTMPLPSYARVTNVSNGSSLVVRVNDRGPYSPGRIIDLSRRAAEMLDYTDDGVAQVKVEYIGRARLDGEDEQYLLASWQPGNRVADPSDGLPTGVMVAMNGPTPSAEANASPFPGMLTDATPQTAVAALQEQAGKASSDAVVPLPLFAPIAPARPAEDGSGTRLASSLTSYADERVKNAADGVFAAFDSGLSADRIVQSWKAGNGPAMMAGADAGFIVAGTFSSRAEAQSVIDTLSRLGRVSWEKSEMDGQEWYSVNLYAGTSNTLDQLLEAAWQSGAADAFIVRN